MNKQNIRKVTPLDPEKLTIINPLTEEQKQQLSEKLKEKELLKWYDTLCRIGRNKLTITTNLEKEVPLGASHFGGGADVAPDFEYPIADYKEEGEKVSNKYVFLGQINFSELRDKNPNNILPNEGMLYIFLNNIEYAADDVKLIYEPKIDITKIKRVKLNPRDTSDLDTAEAIEREVAIEFGNSISFPQYCNPYHHALVDNKNNSDRGNTFSEGMDKLRDLFDEFEPKQQHSFMLGYASEINTDAQIGSAANYFQKPITYSNQNIYEKEIGEMVCLLELNSHDEVDFCFHDAGFYFMIHPDDLQSKNFGDVYFELGTT